MSVKSTILGYPRIGPRRELKWATEKYWSGQLAAEPLTQTAADLRAETWRTLRAAGLDLIPSNTFSFYDQVLDTAVLFDAIPERFRKVGSELDTYFAMARGVQDVPALEMTKWFDTNYHYVVPEIDENTAFRLAGTKPLDEFREAKELGVTTRPVLVGPVTFLNLAKAGPSAADGFRPIDKLDTLVDAYADLLGKLHEAGAEWVQLDEPVVAGDLTDELVEALRATYQKLGDQAARPKIVVATYFGDTEGALPTLARSPIDGIALDFVAGPRNVDLLASIGGLGDKTLFAGVVDGRNVWRTDLRAALSQVTSLLGLAAEVVVSSSASLLHVPIDLSIEAGEGHLDAELIGWLAFAKEKVTEISVLSRALTEGTAVVEPDLAAADAALEARRVSKRIVDEDVRTRAAAVTAADRTRTSEYEERAKVQRKSLDLPELPTTTIGSFPQTAEVRAARAKLRSGEIDKSEYGSRMRAEVDRALAAQEEAGLDVLVHGEPERNDMVQYFAEQLTGYAFTANGWVQSYGSRCVRPPILFGDVSRPKPMTVEWARYAQSATTKPVKGMLTGPVTMLKWAFVRADQPWSTTADQVALALRDEVLDLEAAGIRIIQVDEPALREALPLRSVDRPAYLDWAVASFRLATAGVRDGTGIHTHMCYSEFGEIIKAIDELDADATSVEAARSNMELLAEIKATGYRREIGPGVYDIHSPRIPSVDEMTEALRRAVQVLGPRRLWVNPDCGLKTRGYAEVTPALENLVAAAKQVRSA